MAMPLSLGIPDPLVSTAATAPAQRSAWSYQAIPQPSPSALNLLTRSMALGTWNLDSGTWRPRSWPSRAHPPPFTLHPPPTTGPSRPIAQSLPSLPSPMLANARQTSRSHRPQSLYHSASKHCRRSACGESETLECGQIARASLSLLVSPLASKRRRLVFLSWSERFPCNTADIRLLAVSAPTPSRAQSSHEGGYQLCACTQVPFRCPPLLRIQCLFQAVSTLGLGCLLAKACSACIRQAASSHMASCRPHVNAVVT